MEDVLGHNSQLISLMAAHLIASLAAAEVGHLKCAIMWLMIQSALLAAILATVGYVTGTPHLYLWAVVCVLTKVVLIPRLLWHYSNELPQQEARPIVGLQWSIIVVAIALVGFYRFLHGYLGFVAPGAGAATEPALTSWAIAFTVIALGLYVLAVRRGTIKLVIGIILMENGVHLTLLSLAPTVPQTTLVGVTTNVIILAWLLLYLTAGIYRLMGTTDVTTLSRLRR